MNGQPNSYQANRRPGNVIAHLDPDFASVDRYFSVESKGISVNGTHHITLKDTYLHLLLVGSTGVGKSTTVIIPSIARLEGSIVIHDPSKEIHTIMEKSMLLRGYRIEILNFSEPGSGYNPLRHLKEASDIHLISSLLVRADKGMRTGDEHWTSRAAELIECMIYLVVAMKKEEATLTLVRSQLLEAIADPQKVEGLFREYADEEHILSYTALTKNKTNELSSIFSTASNALKDFSNPNIADVTSRHDIDLSLLRQEKTALFIQNSPNRSHLYNKVISIFFEQLWLLMMEVIPSSSDLDLFVILDECRSLFLPTLPNVLDKARKYRIGFLIAVQSLQQLRTAYRDDALVIEDNCKTHIYLGGQRGDTAEKLERALGKNGGSGANGLRLPREKARMINSNTTLILCNGLPPILGTNVPYYKNPKLSHLVSSDSPKEAFVFGDVTSSPTEKEPWEDIDKEPDWEAADFYL